MAISGDVAVIGASGDDDHGDFSGSAYVFRFDGMEWIEETKLLASDGTPSDHFGLSVSVSGAIAIAGAFLDDDLGADSGSAYVFDLDASDCPCPWDCGDGDGAVGIVDLLALLAQWGTPGPCDLDGNGVGATDLLVLLAFWGPCP